jgi:hypothetical protein
VQVGLGLGLADVNGHVSDSIDVIACAACRADLDRAAADRLPAATAWQRVIARLQPKIVGTFV